MAFYGESYRITIATNIDGTAITDDGLDTIRYHFDDASDTVTAGDSFVVGSELDNLELTETDEAVISWVVETGPASSGLLTLSSGLDPDWTADDPADAAEALGTLSATGEQTLVFGPTSITVTDLFAFAAQPVAFIECASGSVEIQQVKLRVWPPGGASGSWVTGPDHTTTGTDVDKWFATLGSGTALHATFEDAWAELVTIIDDLAGQPVQFTNTDSGDDVGSTLQVFPSLGQRAGSHATDIALILAQPPEPFPSPEVTYGYDPAEVWRETQASIRAIGGGPVAATFVDWTPESVLELSETTYVGSIDFDDEPSLVDVPGFPGLKDGTFHYPTAFTSRSSPVQVSDLGGQWFSVGLLAPLYYGPAPATSTFSDVAGDFGPLTFYALISGYEYFSPSGAAPRFFVKDLEGDWRPVGFGKPADELAVFRVPTAVGMYRDLTTAEYASHGPESRPTDGYPLKVKRMDDDGSTWWDHVAWMVPDE